jgi:hypothetical protein
LRREIAEIKSRAEKPHWENIHCEELLEPFRNKAEQLYPELETDVAVAKLTENLEAVGRPSPRDMYKPLSPDVRQGIISELEGIIANYRGAGPKVRIAFDAGNLIRLQVAESLHGILREAGYRVGGELAISFIQHSPGVSISFNPEDSETAYRIGTAIYKFINNPYSGVEQMERQRATYEIIIAGEPLLSQDGTVTFR